MKEGYKKTELGWIPEEWEVRTIGKVTDIVNGCTPKTNVEEYWKEGNIKWATPTDITKTGKYICDTDKKITKRGFDESSLKLLPIGSILMSSRATIGERCINTIPMCTNQGFKSLICKDNINNEFMYYYIDILKDKMINLSSGSTFLELSKNTLSNLKIVIPPLKEQQKIAEILSTVDSQIDDEDKLIEKTKELKKGLMQRLLTKGIGHSEFKKSEVGEIPVEWEVKQLDNISCLIDGDRSSKYPNQNDIVDEGILFLSTANIKNNKLSFDECRYITQEKFESLNKGKLEDKDLIITLRGTIGSVAKFTKSSQYNTGFINAQMLIIRITDSNISVDYVWSYLASKKCQDIISIVSSGSAQPQLTKRDLSKLNIVLPPLEEQQQIANILTSVDNQIQEYENKKSKLEELKKGLMQQLLTGKIRVV